MNLVILVLIFTFAVVEAKSSEHKGCLLLTEDTNSYVEPDINTDAVPMKSGLIIPYFEKSKDGNFYQISFYNKFYWIEKKKHRLGTENLCSMQPQCFKLTQNAMLYTDPDSSSTVVSTLRKNFPLDWFGQRKINSATAKNEKNKTLWYQVAIADRYAWVEAYKGELEEDSCQGSVFANKKKWHFQVDAEQVLSVSQLNYESAITSVPDPSFVTCLQNPIFTSVSKGSGQSIGVQTSLDFSSWLRLRLGLLYEKVQYRLMYLNNPHPDPGNQNCNSINKTISDLSPDEILITENNIVVPVGAFYKWQINRQHLFIIGVSLNASLNIPPGFSYTYYTGETLSKQTRNEATIKVSQFRTSNDLEIRYTYQFPYRQQEYFGLSIFGKQEFSSEMHFGLGVHF